MTASATNPFVSYAGAGLAGPFAIPFKFLANGDIVAVKIDAAGVETSLTGNTISGAGADAGGTLYTAAAIAVGETLQIYRDTVRTQTAQYVANGPFPAATHERALDKAMLVDQEQDRDLARTVKAPLGEALVSLPSASERAGLVLGFDGDGQLAVGAETNPSLGALVDLSNVSGEDFATVRFKSQVDAFGLSLLQRFSAAIDVRGQTSLSIGASVADYLAAVAGGDVALQAWIDAQPDAGPAFRAAFAASAVMGRMVIDLGPWVYVIKTAIPISNHIYLRGVRGAARMVFPPDCDLSGGGTVFGLQRAFSNAGTDVTTPFDVVFRDVIFDGTSLPKDAGNIVSIAFGWVASFYADDGCRFCDFGSGDSDNPGSQIYVQGLQVTNCSEVYIAAEFDRNGGDGCAVGGDSVTRNFWFDGRCHDNGDWGLATANNLRQITIGPRARFEDNNQVGSGGDEIRRMTVCAGAFARGNKYGFRWARYGVTSYTFDQVVASGAQAEDNSLANFSVENVDNANLSGIMSAGGGKGILLSASRYVNLTGAQITSPGEECIGTVAYTGSTCGGHIITGCILLGGTRGVYELNAGGTVLPSLIQDNIVTGQSLADYTLPVSLPRIVDLANGRVIEMMTALFGGALGAESLRVDRVANAINAIRILGGAAGMPAELRAVGEAVTAMRMGVAGTTGSMFWRDDIFGTPTDIASLTRLGLVLLGGLTCQPPASATPTNNGQLVIQATSNTSLTFKLKGTDGTVRSGSITLS